MKPIGGLPERDEHGRFMKARSYLPKTRAEWIWLALGILLGMWACWIILQMFRNSLALG